MHEAGVQRRGISEGMLLSSSNSVYVTLTVIQAGANVMRELDFTSRHPPRLVLGIKEPPLNEVYNGPGQANTTHMMFSHTAKGQIYNMPLLAKFADMQRQTNDTKPQLIDYELLVNKETGKRTVAFGWYAGGNLDVQAFPGL